MIKITEEYVKQCEEQFAAKGRFKSKTVCCVKCEKEKFLFHASHVANTVEKYGSVKNLLENFTCKDCSPKLVKVKSPKKKLAKIKKEAENQDFEMPKYDHKGPRGVEYDLLANPEVCAEVTTNSCWHPDLYLNNLKSCHGCALYANCQSGLKNMKVKIGNKKSKRVV